MGKARILAVDDQRYFRELTEGLLTDAGYDVQTASSGDEALHILERDDFDIIVTDLVMPGIDGSELVRRIKERRPEQDVVMVTGVVDVKTAVEAMKQGATDYILKPFDRKALTDSMEKILKQRRLREEHALLMEENLEFMGVLSLFERAAGLFSTLAVEPLAERLIEGLCLETRAQSGVLWVAEERGSHTLNLVGVRGLVRVDGEPVSVDLDEVVSLWCPALETGRSAVTAMPEDANAVEALYVPIRVDGATIGVARLTDKLGDESFGESDRAMAEKFCEFGGIAMNNAMRFHALERRSLRDPETCTYTRAYFDDAVRNEIQKANRFSHRFSILRLEIGGPAAAGAGQGRTRSIAEVRDAQELSRQIAGALRATDLLASDEGGAYCVLLPQTDALGASILTQRIRKALGSATPADRGPSIYAASATFPVDGTQLDSLTRMLEERVEQSRQSLLATRSDLVRSRPLDPMFDRILELGSVHPAEIEGQILRFVLEDVVRRPGDRGVLFLSPGARWLSEMLETLHEIRGTTARTEIVVLAEADDPDPESKIKWITKSALDSRRPFVVYFGDGPAFAMIGQIADPNDRAPIFETADRTFVEHLAFELQRELGILISV
jgi:FixJ family two-component response regulator/GGDEF domain-containing protein